MGATVTYYADDRDRVYARPTTRVFHDPDDAAAFASGLAPADLVAFARDGLTVAAPTRRFLATAGFPATPETVDPALGPLARYRSEAQRARLDGELAVTAWLGDSFTESFEPSARRARWIELLADLLNRPGGHRVLYVPAAANTFSSVTATDWPGDEAPWTYSPAPAGRTDFGADLHAVTVPTGGTATLAYAGDIINLITVRTPGGPTAATVTIDGTQVGTINAQGAEEAGQVAAFGTSGDYGAHTLTVTAVGAPLVLEGAIVHDGVRFPFGVPFGAISTLAFGHAGFNSQHFVDNPNWTLSFTRAANSFHGRASLVGIALGANDPGAGISPDVFGANLVTIMQRLDDQYAANGAVGGPTGYLLIVMPSLTVEYVEATWDAAVAYGPDRCTVLDLGALLPDRASWGIFDAGNGHPNNAGQAWIAEAIAAFIDPAHPARPSMRTGGPVIEAADEPTRRSSWAAGLAAVAAGTYDASPTGTGTHELRHRVWLDAGTYTPRLRAISSGTNATAEVAIGASSAGTTVVGGTVDTPVEATLSAVALPAPGWYPVRIRKSGANTGALRFSRLFLRQTG